MYIHTHTHAAVALPNMYMLPSSIPAKGKDIHQHERTNVQLGSLHMSVTQEGFGARENCCAHTYMYT